MRSLQAERLFRIHELIEARPWLFVEDLMRELEVSRATIKRDIAFLRDRLQAPLIFDRDRGYRYEGAAGPRFERLRPTYVELTTTLRAVVDVMERCEPAISEEQRATDEQWLAALSLARAALATAGAQ